MSKQTRAAHDVAADQLETVASLNPRPLHCLAAMLAKPDVVRRWVPRVGWRSTVMAEPPAESVSLSLSVSGGQALAAYNDGGTVVTATWPAKGSQALGPVTLYAEDVAAIGKPTGSAPRVWWHADGLIGSLDGTRGAMADHAPVTVDGAAGAEAAAYMDLGCAARVDLASDVDWLSRVGAWVSELSRGSMATDSVTVLQGTTHLHVMLEGTSPDGPWTLMAHAPAASALDALPAEQDAPAPVESAPAVPDAEAMAASVSASAVLELVPVPAPGPMGPDPVAVEAAPVEAPAIVGRHHNGAWSEPSGRAPRHLAAESGPVASAVRSMAKGALAAVSGASAALTSAWGAMAARIVPALEALWSSCGPWALAASGPRCSWRPWPLSWPSSW